MTPTTQIRPIVTRMLEATCRHFTGLPTGCCAAGVAYTQGSPCTTGLGADPCPARAALTVEEVEARADSHMETVAFVQRRTQCSR